MSNENQKTLPDKLDVEQAQSFIQTLPENHALYGISISVQETEELQQAVLPSTVAFLLPRNGSEPHGHGECVGMVQFQNGPVHEVGVNGIGIEHLLEVVAGRLRGYQTTKYACRQNALALTKVEEALMWLRHRTEDRQRRGVEGKGEK